MCSVSLVFETTATYMNDTLKGVWGNDYIVLVAIVGPDVVMTCSYIDRIRLQLTGLHNLPCPSVCLHRLLLGREFCLGLLGLLSIFGAFLGA